MAYDESSLQALMIKDHLKLTSLLERVKEALKEGSSEAPARLDFFRWELEKHLFIEEKAIFIFYSPKDDEAYSTLSRILNEHIVILDTLSDLQKDIKEGKKVSIRKFQMFLIKHKDLEDEIFYPKLDLELSQENKRKIRDRVAPFY